MPKRLDPRPARERSARAQAPAAAAAPASQASDLDVLHPERAIRIAGRLLEVREYGYIEGLKIQSGIQPFLDQLFALFSRAVGRPPAAEAVREVFVAHAATVQWMLAQAITPVADDPVAFVEAVEKNVQWVATLGDIDGDLLTAVWWGVNSGFFTRRLRERALAEKQAANPSGAASSTQS